MAASDAGDLSPNTAQPYGLPLRNHVRPALGALRLREVATTRVDDFLQALATGVPASSAGRVAKLEPDDLPGRRRVRSASPPVGEVIDDQQAAAGLVAARRLAGHEWQRTGQAITDLDFEPGPVVVQEQLDGAAAVQDGVGHHLAGKQLDEIKQAGRPRCCSGGKVATGESRRCQRVGKRLRLRLDQIHDSDSLPAARWDECCLPRLRVADPPGSRPISRRGETWFDLEDGAEAGDRQQPVEEWSDAVQGQPTALVQDVRPGLH